MTLFWLWRLGAADSISLSPQCVGWVAIVRCGVGLVHTLAVEEVGERCFVNSFVYVDSTLHAFQIARGLSIGAFILAWLLCLLFGQQILDAQGSCGFLWRRCRLGGWCSSDVLNLNLRTLFMQSGLKDAGGEPLMHACPTCTALEATSVGLPSMMGVGPWLLALADQVLFALLGALALVAWGL